MRTSVLVVDGNRLLLVREVDARTGAEYWVPPGGGVEEVDEDVFASARREVIEETGILVEIGDLVYLREFHDSVRDTRWLELYFLANGSARPERSSVAPDLMREARWFTRDELRQRVVYPDVLKSAFWEPFVKDSAVCGTSAAPTVEGPFNSRQERTTSAALRAAPIAAQPQGR